MYELCKGFATKNFASIFNFNLIKSYDIRHQFEFSLCRLDI